MLKRISEIHGIPCVLAMKMETTNPGGSSKDRPALEMILAAERDGLLLPGGTIVEPTSGNTGVGLAIVAAQRGYSCVFVMTDKVAPEKISLLRAYGAEVIVCPVAVPPEDPQSYYSVAERLTIERKAFRPNQYANPNNPLAHELTTGPELWRQTGGRITHFVAGAGTCGTITGVARYLKRRTRRSGSSPPIPMRRCSPADPAGPYLVEGVGEDFYPAAWAPELYDDVIAISDEESFLTARQVSREEGILIGGSGGMAVAAAIRVAKRGRSGRHRRRAQPGLRSRLPVQGLRRPVDGQLRLHPRVRPVRRRGARHPRRHAVAAVRQPDDTVRQAIDVMRANGISQLPVCKNTPPFANAEVSGAVDELDLMEAVHRDPGVMSMAVESVMGPKLPTIGVGQQVALAVEMLDASPALLVLSGGRPLSVLTRTDLLTYFEAASAMGELERRSRPAGGSRPARSTPGRSPTRPPAQSSRRSR